MQIQPESTLVEFIRYNQWANQQVLAACAGLSEVQLTAAIPGTYGSVRATFHHVLRAEADYINRITGNLLQPPFSWDAAPSIAELSSFAAEVGAAFVAVVETVPPTQNVHEEEDGLTMDYQARHLFMQAVNHGINHRTDITTFLTSQGIAVPEVDGWGYMFAHQERFGMREGKAPGA
jgi:uncharacterized damage-inducible protein DinB